MFWFDAYQFKSNYWEIFTDESWKWLDYDTKVLYNNSAWGFYYIKQDGRRI